MNRFFNRQTLDAGTFDRMYHFQRPDEIPHDVDRMSPVVDEHASPAGGAVRIPTRRHIDKRHERVLEQHDLAENAGIDDISRPYYILGIAEFRSHGKQRAVLTG